MGAFDEARDVRHDEALVLVHGHDTEVWYQGRERIVGDLRARVRNGREQGGQALGGLQDHVAAVPAVAAVGASVGNVLLPAEAPAPVPTVPRLHVNFDLINEIHEPSSP